MGRLLAGAIVLVVEVVEEGRVEEERVAEVAAAAARGEATPGRASARTRPR